MWSLPACTAGEELPLWCFREAYRPGHRSAYNPAELETPSAVFTTLVGPLCRSAFASVVCLLTSIPIILREAEVAWSEMQKGVANYTLPRDLFTSSILGG